MMNDLCQFNAFTNAQKWSNGLSPQLGSNQGPPDLKTNALHITPRRPLKEMHGSVCIWIPSRYNWLLICLMKHMSSLLFRRRRPLVNVKVVLLVWKGSGWIIFLLHIVFLVLPNYGWPINFINVLSLVDEVNLLIILEFNIWMLTILDYDSVQYMCWDMIFLP